MFKKHSPRIMLFLILFCFLSTLYIPATAHAEKIDSSTPTATPADPLFTEKDYTTYLSMQTPTAVDDYDTVLTLLNKLQHTNRDQFHLAANRHLTYDDLLHDLEQRKASIEASKVKIAQINKDLNVYYMEIERASSKDREIINRLLREINALSEPDQQKIAGVEALQKASTKLNTRTRTLLIKIIIVMILLLFIAPVFIHITKTHKSKKKQPNEN